ncbi:MAG: HypC/HybG/HupF family hydrogenase formation chaperone [Methylovulum sp.]|uniref:HypC/HybG/HupF family hydrogenase formation chaperone n=1 Tax=Methylovulum sp. TaxID=1916980 RepID=UPI0026330C3C|nr:HypC/HybG/HupF family hydrogenase formation chaperone [Methylovulum sp.]MDD2724418.1 HypC/HybG/HupF family hydrogenase formation chaperone [Methylovulum sp.]MDD5123997.1 HypC/HybG/HupF family hydrogenase formation chaperone [Methylovulum sp.]
MCIGIPMQIYAQRGEMAVCLHGGQEHLIDMMLVGLQPTGTWVLVFLDTAREVLGEEKARQITDALEAMRLAMQGETRIDHLFADLVNREPSLPEFLQS